MDHILEVLRVSVDNEQRKAAAIQLQNTQKQNPEQFLNYTWAGISSPQVPQGVRFFLCSTVAAFVEESWHNGVPKALQEKMLHQYAHVVVNECLPSLGLARKLAFITALMARRGAGKAQPQELPPLVDYLALTYINALRDACGTEVEGGGLAGQTNASLLPQRLLNLHMLLKEAQTMRIGRVFEILCRKLVEPLSTVFSRLSSASHLEYYDAYLYLLKCALRVFGCGIFEPSFYPYLLEATWGLCGGLNSVEGPDERVHRLRLLEYAMKIHEKMVVFFPTQLKSLSPTFFVPSPSPVSYASYSLFELVVVLIETRSFGVASKPSNPNHSDSFPSEAVDVVSEKLACRAARLLTMFLTAEDGDPFVRACVEVFCGSTLLSRLLRSLIVGCFVDDPTAVARGAWDDDAERVAAEVEVDLDDEASLIGCGEQLFLALTASSAGGPASLRVVWPLVRGLLQEGGEAEVTAALHAIGIGYYTMAAGGDHSDYLDFLQGKLLPMMQSASLGAAAAPSLLVLRRVVWLVGMWCESVPQAAHRREVHAALETVLRVYQGGGGGTVMALTALRAVENFVSDNNFTPEELTPTSLETIFGSIQGLLPRLRLPASVKEVAGLIHVLIEKGAVRAHGDFLLDVFLPAAAESIAACGAAPAGGGGGRHASTAQREDVESEGEGEERVDSSQDLSTLSVLLECLQSSIRVCATDDAVWQLFAPVVLRCTTPGEAATPWVEDNAWALLLEMCRGTGKEVAAGAPFQAIQEEALRWSLQNTLREFPSLHLALRCVYTLLLAREGATEDFFGNASTPNEWVKVMWNTPIPELQSAFFCALAVIVRRGGYNLRRGVLLHTLALIAASADIQAEQAGVLAACLAYACLPVPDPMLAVSSSGESHGVLSDLSETINGQPQLLEKLVLLLDISPNRLCTRSIAVVLRKSAELLQQISPTDRNMVHLALESTQADMGEPSVAPSMNNVNDDAEYNRPAIELLLELLGDETVNPNSPHLHRLSLFFADLLV